METKIKIGNEEYELKYTIRTMFFFERIANKEFNPTKYFDLHIWFYCCLVANNPNFNLDAEQFITACDKDPNLFVEFLKFFNKSLDIDKQFNDVDKEEDGEVDDKKKD